MNRSEWMRSLGYTNAGVPMADKIKEWWGWYTAEGDFYAPDTERSGSKRFKVSRISMRPARMVCEDWASLVMNEGTTIGVDGEEGDTEAAIADAYLQEWIESSRFLYHAPHLVERLFALGTAGWALRLEGMVEGAGPSPDTRFVPQRFDARHIVPLTFDEDDCTEAAFTSSATVRGERLTQVQLYRIGERGTYEIHTGLFDKRGEQKIIDGITTMVDTGITTPPFALMRTGLDNTHWDYSPFGVSVFEPALGAVQLLDEALNNTWSDLYLGRKMVFIDEDMLEVDARGNVTVPRAADQQLFRKVGSGAIGDDKGIAEYNPALRVADNRMALSTALELLAKRCGFGPGYYSLDKAGQGIRTATEVASDNSELMRNVVKHELAISPAIERICEAVIALGSAVHGHALPDVRGRVRVVFDDSIIEDTEALRRRDREEVSAGLMKPWEYRMKWRAEAEETAKAMTESDDVLNDATL